jgi:serine/threonine protein kinase
VKVGCKLQVRSVSLMVLGVAATAPLLPRLQVLRRNYGKEADIWSCGVMLYILLSGMPPFYGDNEQQIFDAVLRNKPDFETEPWPKLSGPAKVSAAAAGQSEGLLHALLQTLALALLHALNTSVT